jgi:hypothetical protein
VLFTGSDGLTALTLDDWAAVDELVKETGKKPVYDPTQTCEHGNRFESRVEKEVIHELGLCLKESR